MPEETISEESSQKSNTEERKKLNKKQVEIGRRRLVISNVRTCQAQKTMLQIARGRIRLVQGIGHMGNIGIDLGLQINHQKSKVLKALDKLINEYETYERKLNDIIIGE